MQLLYHLHRNHRPRLHHRRILLQTHRQIHRRLPRRLIHRRTLR